MKKNNRKKIAWVLCCLCIQHGAGKWQADVSGFEEQASVSYSTQWSSEYQWNEYQWNSTQEEYSYNQEQGNTGTEWNVDQPDMNGQSQTDADWSNGYVNNQNQPDITSQGGGSYSGEQANTGSENGNIQPQKSSDINAQNENSPNIDAQNQASANPNKSNTDIYENSQNIQQSTDKNTGQNTGQNISRNTERKTDAIIQSENKKENDASTETTPGADLITSPPAAERTETEKANEKTNEKINQKTNKTTDTEKKTKNNTEKNTNLKDSDYAEEEDFRKEYPVYISHEKKLQPGETARIQIRTKGSVQILSLRLNGTETPWHWEKNEIVLDREIADTENTENIKNTVELLLLTSSGKPVKMDPWSF